MFTPIPPKRSGDRSPGSNDRRQPPMKWQGPLLIMAGFGWLLVLLAPNDDRNRVGRVKSDVVTLTRAVEAYKARVGTYPHYLQELVQPPEGKPFVEADILIGPWGSYAYDRSGLRNQGQQPDIWAATPDAMKVVGNWM